MTESIKFGPEWLRNSVANVIAAPSPQQQQHHPQQSHHQQPQSPSTDSIISRPVLSDHRYGREEMLSLCDKTARLPEALPRFRRLFVADWQMPLALQPNTDDEQVGSRGLGGTGTPPWGGTHIRPLMPAMGGGRGTGIIRGGAIERGRGRGRGLYHGTSYTRSTSLYDEEGRRWLDRNGTDGTTEWSAGSAVSPRKEGFSRGTLESWRKGTREENEEGWRSNSNGTTSASTGPTARDKWARSTSWRDGATDNGVGGDPDRANGSQSSNHQNSSSPAENGNGGVGPGGMNMVNSSNVPTKPQASYKKSWDDDGNLPEWATESFDYGGTFDATGAFHDSDRVLHDDEDKKQHIQSQQPQHHEPPELDEPIKQDQEPSPPPAKFMDFLNEDTSQPPQMDNHEKQPPHSQQPEPVSSVPNVQIPISTAPIAQMDKMVENFVAHLIMDDDSGSVKQPPVPLIEWFYRDPQGDTQGPFSSNDMSEWYKAGYFQESLMVRRSIDSSFVPLGHLVKIFGVARPFISATIDGGTPIPPVIHPEIIDPFRMQRIHQAPAPTIQQPAQPTPPDVNNWSMMTTEQRMFLMQLAHQRPPQPQVDQFKAPPVVPQQPPQAAQEPLRRIMGGGDFFSSAAAAAAAQPPAPVQPVVPQSEPDPIQQLIMQLQIQQKTGGVDNAAQQWIKSSQQQQQQGNVLMGGVNSGNGPLDLSSLAGMQQGGAQQSQSGVNQQGPSGVGSSMVQNTSSTHWNATPLPIWEMASSANAQKEQTQQSLQQQQQQAHPTLQEVQQQMRQQQHQHSHHHLQQQQQQHQNQSHQEPDILQNGLIEDQSSNQMQMQKVESKKKKKDAKEQQQVKQQPEQPQQKEPKKQKESKKSNEKQKKEEKSTQPAAPAPWVGIQQSVPGTSLSKIQKTEAQRRQVELAAQKEREHQKLEMMSKMEIRDVKWNLQMPPAANVKSLDEIQAEEQTAAEREAKREKKEAVQVVGDIWNTGAHSMAWQQPKAWSAGQSNAGFWEDPVKATGDRQQKQPQMLSKSQTMATISTAKKQQQQPQVQNVQQQQQQHIQQQQQKRNDKNDGKKKDKNEKKKEDNEFTMWCTRTLSAMNGNVDVPTFVSFLQDIESPFEVKDYIKMYLGETKDCTEFAKQFLERRSKQRMQQRQQNAHIDDMCSPAPAINPQANNSSDFQEVKGKNKKIKAKKVMKAVDNRILGFTATSAPDRINVGDRDYGDA